ncbi:hypothetical protein [Helicobacter pylori]|uniref:hypothetical protein n=1 Tax=Helicobacter pylori TaxID=210 RepID=UPI001E454CCD|nr:hypothetical protein [Helicobacter pylori]
MTIINLFEKTCNKRGFYGECYKKSGLDDKKALESEAHTKTLLMAKACLKLNNHNIVTAASLTLNSGAFL